jgi:hypothetical protein
VVPVALLTILDKRQNPLSFAWEFFFFAGSGKSTGLIKKVSPSVGSIITNTPGGKTLGLECLPTQELTSHPFPPLVLFMNRLNRI